MKNNIPYIIVSVIFIAFIIIIALTNIIIESKNKKILKGIMINKAKEYYNDKYGKKLNENNISIKLYGYEGYIYIDTHMKKYIYLYLNYIDKDVIQIYDNIEDEA